MSIYLIIGVLLFGLIHLYPAIFVNNRQTLINRIGIGPYKGIYSLYILLSLVMIISGWWITTSVNMFAPPDWGKFATILLMYPTLFLFVSAGADSNIKRIIRRPQLTTITLWGVAHLLSNGESRSLILFGLFALWAVIEMFFLNRRDGDWQKPEPLPLSRDIKVAVIALVVYVGLIYGHGYFTGVTLVHS